MRSRSGGPGVSRMANGDTSSTRMRLEVNKVDGDLEAVLRRLSPLRCRFVAALFPANAECVDGVF